MTQITFEQIEAPQPNYEQVAASYREIESQLEAATSAEACLEAVDRWDTLRRKTNTWESMVSLRFCQETTNPQYKADRDTCDKMEPKFTDLDVRIKRILLACPHRAGLEKALGAHCFALWETHCKAFDPAIEASLVKESALSAEYTELIASADIAFQGESHNLGEIQKYSQQPDRQVRHEAATATWNWFDKHSDTLDRIFTEMVTVRTSMAHQLGYNSFTELGYQRMSRVDYNEQDVDRYRAAVRETLVPLCSDITRRQAEGLEVDSLMIWDEPLHDRSGNPRPQGDHDWMLAKAQAMFDAMGGELDEFFRLMQEAHLLDLKIRKGKANGGFCTSFPSYGLPYIFANFNGTKGDVEVFTHEVGHAFQGYLSRHQRLCDYLWPTYESCEIHSMSLEFLTWPHMEKFFGEDADRFRRIHLTQSLLFIPYGVAVDHFQHLVYAEPEASPQRRHEMWLELEQTYLPWRNWGDLQYGAQGGSWQMKQHIYLSPFYYIDYTLAQACALQFWARSEKDFAEAMTAYVALCRRGGEAPFQELAAGAGLISPFAENCLRDVVAQARQTLSI